MSRIGRKPINIPAGVTASVDNGVITVKGPKGTLDFKFNPAMTVEIKGDVIEVTRPNDAKENRSLHGLTRTLIHNMVINAGDDDFVRIGNFNLDVLCILNDNLV